MNFSNIRIVLVETSHSGNIGSTARAMMNMGLTRLVLVKPRQWPSQDATSMAVSAASLLETAVVVDTLEAAVADCHVVIGTSARMRNMPIPMLDPGECALKALEVPSSQQVALVFGREISGLTNDELQRCHFHVHIPVNPDYSSLNLAAAVMVLCYELRKTALAKLETPPAPAILNGNKLEERDSWDQEPATADDLERYLVHLEKVLINIEFHKPQHKRPLMVRLRRLYQRLQLDKMEVGILRGILTATEQAAQKARFPVETPTDPGDP